MPVELDHLFICVSAGAPEADRLIRFGLTEGASNTHPGQGTANRRFFFRNAFLELLWVVDPAEARSPLVNRTRLWERWSGGASAASPFGICFRSAPGAVEVVPFATWTYRPAYLPDPLAIDIGINSELVTEPLLFSMAFGRPPDTILDSRRQPMEHAAGMRTITRVIISGPQTGTVSAELRTVEHRCRRVSFVPGSTHLMELGFDDELKGQSADFRPTLPLIFRW